MAQPDESHGGDDRLLGSGNAERFLYQAVHELKAPLRAVTALSSCIEQDLGAGVEPLVAENLALLRRRVKRMAGLLDSLTAFIEAGEDRSPAVDFDLGALAQELADKPPGRPGIEVTVAAGPCPVHAPKEPVRRVLACLLDNAVRHHDKARGTVALSWAVQEGQLVVRVSDDGPGIPEGQQEKVFQIFRTLKAPDETDGNGVGLALVKRTLERHGGDVRLESKPGLGCVFTVAWPNSPGPRP